MNNQSATTTILAGLKGGCYNTSVSVLVKRNISSNQFLNETKLKLPPRLDFLHLSRKVWKREKFFRTFWMMPELSLLLLPSFFLFSFFLLLKKYDKSSSSFFFLSFFFLLLKKYDNQRVQTFNIKIKSNFSIALQLCITLLLILLFISSLD